MACLACGTRLARGADSPEVQAKISKALAELATKDLEARRDGCVILSQIYLPDREPPALSLPPPSAPSPRSELYFVIPVLEDPHPEVRAACILAASHLATPNEHPLDDYIRACADDDANVRASGATALGRMRPIPLPGVVALASLLDRETAELVKRGGFEPTHAYQTALNILHNIDMPEAKAALQRHDDAFALLQKHRLNEQEAREEKVKAEAKADADAEQELYRLPWLALKIVALVFLVSGAIRLWRRRKG